MRQHDHDVIQWAHDPGDATIEHVLLHICKLVGKLGAYCEAAAHGEAPPVDGINTGVIPDLLMHALRLANNAGLDLEELINARWIEVRGKFDPQPEV